MNWQNRLEESLRFHNEHACSESSKVEFICANIFNIYTYDSVEDEFLGGKCVDVALAITNNTNFEYIRNTDNYRWYLSIVHFPFFAERITWGTSIRGAWWDIDDDDTFSTCGLLGDDGEQKVDWKFSKDGWKQFMLAIGEFVK